MKETNKYYEETVKLLEPFFLGRPFGFKIGVIDNDHFVTVINQREYGFGEQRKGEVLKYTALENLTEEQGERLFDYLFMNRQLLEEFKEQELDMDREWEIEPMEIKTEEGDTIGAVGMIRDEVAQMNRVVFLSSDGTASTLTLWEKPEDKELAIADLREMSLVLMELTTKLKSYDK